MRFVIILLVSHETAVARVVQELKHQLALVEHAVAVQRKQIIALREAPPGAHSARRRKHAFTLRSMSQRGA